MKKNLYFIAIVLICFAGCNSLKTSTSGKENEAFLEFIGVPNNYPGGVDVNIDDKTNFKAEINVEKAHSVKAKVYAISTGTHILTITYNNKILVKMQIFVSVQETKKITLP